MPKCRFCSNLLVDDRTGDPKCVAKDKILSFDYAKRKRQCESFKLIDCPNDVKDYFFEVDYKEDRTNKKSLGHQLSIDELIGKD